MPEPDSFTKIFNSFEDRLTSIVQEAVFKAMSDYYETHPIPKAEATLEDDLTDVKGIAAYTKYSVFTIYAYVEQSKIPYYRQPNCRRLIFSKKEVLEWIKGEKNTTKEELVAEARNIKIHVRKNKPSNK
ncbi:MAG TPA: helix-turn-helix domain-containing protein [Bacteroidales bacterium]|nr:helix-turn-helix domain-containing protein [Bacteroidales bacterium]